MRQSTACNMAVIALIAAMWAWPAAVFLPVLIASSSLSVHVVSAVLTFALGLGVTFVGWRWLRHASVGTQRVLTIATVATAVLGVGLYLVLVQSGYLGGLGGDRGDALDVALRRLFAGEYPYSELTSWGGKITPLPGGLLLALPAHLAAHAGFATLYLVPLAAFVLWRVDRTVAVIATVAVVLSPSFWADALSSGDLVVTSFLLFAVALGTIRSASSLSSSGGGVRAGGFGRWHLASSAQLA